MLNSLVRNGLAGEKVKKKKTEKKEPVVRKPAPSSLSAAAALMGKQRLSSMFTSSIFKKNSGRDDKTKTQSCDTIVDDIIAEFAPDEADRERRRMGHPNGRGSVLVGNAKVERETVDCIGFADKPDLGHVGVSRDLELVSEDISNSILDDELIKESKEGTASTFQEQLVQLDESDRKDRLVEDSMPRLVDVKSEAEKKKEEIHTLNAKITEEKDPRLSATAGWKAVISEGLENSGSVAGAIRNGAISEEKLDFELNLDGTLPFYMFDAHEEIYGANAGNLYLFGKVCP